MATTADVPGRFDVAVDGTGFMLWEDVDQPALIHQSIRVQKEQNVNPDAIGESSVNPEGFWRRSIDGWHHGAGQCLVPETRVLTSDMRWVPVGDLEVGQSIVAFEEERSDRRWRQWRQATVEATERYTLPCYRLLMSDGSKIVASEGHLWLTRNRGTWSWTKTSNLTFEQKHGKNSSKFMKVFEPWEEDRSWGAGYLAASFDGEGCFTQTKREPRANRTLLVFSQRDNDMLKEVCNELDVRGFRYSLKNPPTSGTNGDVWHAWILGGVPEVMRLIGSIRPRRLLENLRPLINGQMRGTPVHVIEKEFIGEQEVVGLKTSTGTLIAEGFASHNSYFDRAESDPLRFHESRGVDVFGIQHQATLLHALEEAYGVDYDETLLTVGGFTFFVDNAHADLKYVSSPLSLPWTPSTVAGTPTSMTNLTAIGSTMFIGSSGSDGIYSMTAGIGGASAFTTGVSGAIYVGVAKSRLLAWQGDGTFYNVTVAGALPSPLITFAADQFVIGVADGPNHIYIAVRSLNGQSQIYKTAIKPDGTALDVPTVAGELPIGEDLVISGSLPLFCYANHVFVHSTSGIRMASVDGDGNLLFGSPIDTVDGAGGVASWAAHDRFVYSTYRYPSDFMYAVACLDLTVATLPVTPAYAPDVMPPDGHAILALSQQHEVLMVRTTDHIYVRTDDYVESGYVTSGLVALDLADPKAPVAFDVEGGGLDADHSIVEALSYDRGATFTTVGTWNAQTDGETPITGQAAVRQFEIKTTLTSDGADTPTLYRHTLKVEPAVNQGDYVILRLRLYESVVTNTGESHTQNPDTLRAALSALQESRAAVTLQEGGTDYTVTIRDMDWEAHTRTAASSDGTWNGVATIRCKKVPV